ncbi:MAG: MDR family oxidoreductase [Rhodothermales bacterium]
MDTPRALVLERRDDRVEAAVRRISESQLPDGDTVVDVRFSSLNYKDALAVTGEGKIVRGSYPFVPGIDLVGQVRSCTSEAFQPGDWVIGTGWGLGETQWGGYAQVQCVPADHLVRLPDGLSPEAAMVAGTAGLTAMLAVRDLASRGLSPDRGDVVVTGASGGVGSFAVALLAAEGYSVEASTGSESARPYLERLGAARVIDRAELSSGASKLLDSARWAAAVDVVGGRTLEGILSRLDRYGAVAACGLAGGHEIHTTVYPFILRGISLLGIDSNTCPNVIRDQAWNALANRLTDALVREIRAEVISLEDIPTYSRRMLSGAVQGRIVVDLNVA